MVLFSKKVKLHMAALALACHRSSWLVSILSSTESLIIRSNFVSPQIKLWAVAHGCSIVS